MAVFKRWFPVLFLLANGLLYGVLSYLFIAEPLRWFNALAIELRDPVGYTELKTTYIGLMGTLALFFLLAVLVSSLRLAGLLLALLSYGALAIVRAWGVLLLEVSNDMMLQLLLVEIVSFLLAVLALYCQLGRDRQPRSSFR